MSQLPTIKTEAEFQRALSEIEQLLEEPHELSVEDRYFAYLLGQIADYHESLPPARRDETRDQLQELEQNLKAYGVHWPHPQAEDRHWSPSLPPDLHPHLTRR